MALRIGDHAPNFTAETMQGPVKLSDRMRGSWTLLLSLPKDFTPAGTTELGVTDPSIVEVLRVERLSVCGQSYIGECPGGTSVAPRTHRRDGASRGGERRWAGRASQTLEAKDHACRAPAAHHTGGAQS